MPRMKKIDRAREYGRQVAQNVIQSFRDNPEDRGSNFTWTWLCTTWIPKYVIMQMNLNFGPSFPVKQVYLDAALDAARLTVLENFPDAA